MKSQTQDNDGLLSTKECLMAKRPDVDDAGWVVDDPALYNIIELSGVVVWTTQAGSSRRSRAAQTDKT